MLTKQEVKQPGDYAKGCLLTKKEHQVWEISNPTPPASGENLCFSVAVLSAQSQLFTVDIVSCSNKEISLTLPGNSENQCYYSVVLKALSFQTHFPCFTALTFYLV